MKIAIIETKLNLSTGGGSNHHLHLVASELVNLGHMVTVITLEPYLDRYPDNLPYRVIGESLTARLDRKSCLSVQRVLHRYESQVDIFHLWGPWFLWGGALYRQLGGKVPVVVNLITYSFCSNWMLMDMNCCRHCGLVQKILHRPENLTRKALLLPLRVFDVSLDTLLRNHVDAFTPIFEAMAKMYSWQGFDRSKMVVIPAPIDYQYLHQLREAHNFEPVSKEQYNILYVGRLSPEKGVDILVNAMARLDFPVRLHIAGDGPQKNELERLTKELEIGEKVIFHGWVPHEKVAGLCLGSQLFVHPARWPEVLCLSVLEAMAIGMPIIVSDYGDAASALNGAGLTFKRGDTDDLVKKIKILHDTPSLAARLAAEAQKKAKDFDFHKTVPRLLEVYKSVSKARTVR